MAKECDCYFCKMRARGVPENVVMAKLMELTEAKIAKDGWVIHYIVDRDRQTPTGVNIHTHGLEELVGQKDLQLVAPISEDFCSIIFTSIIEQMLKGVEFKPGEIISEELMGFPMVLAVATETGRLVHRIILPDADFCLEKGRMTKPYSLQWEGAE